ncbi:MAG: DUF1207 domain-containing protein [Elusimicrobiota bacterium]|nr:DUF1207 domain-containing protein [Elusimicrobiota bacterium]
MRVSLLLLLLAAPALAGPESRPKPGEVFPPLLADPRQVQMSGSFYRHRGRNAFDLGLGRAWGLKRWRSGEDRSLLWEADLEGMSYSRFRVESGRGDFETVDFVGALPVTVRRGDASFKGSVFVENSHLGDDHIRRYGSAGFRYSTVGLRLLGALEPHRALRAYGGVTRYLHSAPAPERWALQLGLEATGEDLRLSRVPVRPYAATDFQPRERAGWNPDWRTVAGLKLGDPLEGRVVRVQAGYHTGRSPFHQFYRERDHYADLSVVLEL